MDAARSDVLAKSLTEKLPAPAKETDAFPVRGTPGGHHDWWEAADESATAQAEDAALQRAIERDRETHTPRSRTNDQPTL